MLEKGHEHKTTLFVLLKIARKIWSSTQWLASDYGEILLIFQMICQTFILVSASVEMKKKRRM